MAAMTPQDSYIEKVRKMVDDWDRRRDRERGEEAQPESPAMRFAKGIREDIRAARGDDGRVDFTKAAALHDLRAQDDPEGYREYLAKWGGAGEAYSFDATLQRNAELHKLADATSGRSGAFTTVEKRDEYVPRTAGDMLAKAVASIKVPWHELWIVRDGHAGPTRVTDSHELFGLLFFVPQRNPPRWLQRAAGQRRRECGAGGLVRL